MEIHPIEYFEYWVLNIITLVARLKNWKYKNSILSTILRYMNVQFYLLLCKLKFIQM